MEEKDEESFKRELDAELAKEIGELKNFEMVPVNDHVSRVVRKGVTIEEIPDVEKPSPVMEESFAKSAAPVDDGFVLLKSKK
jgi:hypothetical protein